MVMMSIIIPMFDVEHYIAECLLSLKRQSFSDFEVICIDDGSSDETVARARGAVAGDVRFTIIEQENKGQSAARNVALAQATGRFILFLDSDDYYADDALAKLAERICEDDLDLLCFSAETFYETEELRRTHNENQSNRVDIPGTFTGEQLYVRMEKTKSFRPSACMFALSRSLIEEAGVAFAEGIIHEDLLFTMQVMPLAHRAGFLNEPLYQRRMRPESTMTSQRGMRNVRGLFTVWRSLESWISRNNAAYGDEFCDCFMHRTADTEHDLARDLLYVGASAVEEYRDTLDRDDRLALDRCWEYALFLDAAIHELADSRTFKAGRVIMAVPSWVKSRLTFPS